ncbi:Kinase, SCY1 [Spironucleus salmonicida]|uniref:Kinase, SCY1 n=1 Tax=Spironucleus salmonicida TaxID=348837 RepID=V6LEZ7_9EUKA|nr:Kinase, SCY1 [Spironucleus salmonicida]|eukprot:EST43072.1 Kinase, SCY1 [Spironucleus salmonicida]
MFGFKTRCKDFDVVEQSGVGGTHGIWQTYDALQKKTNAPATVWVLDKKAVEKAWFKKDAQGFKTFMNCMKRDQTPVQPPGMQLKIMQPLEDDSSYMVYVTTRIITTLFGLLARYGDLGIASSQLLMPLNFSPDLLFYGFVALLNDLGRLHAQGIVFGNLTPANIAVLPTGELALAGFAMTEHTALQFVFHDDAAAWFRPSAFYLTAAQISAQASTAASDVAQLVFSLFSAFGNRSVNFADASSPQKKFPGADAQIADLSGKLMGVCPPFQSCGISVAGAVQNARLLEQFWSGFQQNSNQYYSLSKFGYISSQMGVCARGEAQNATQLLGVIESSVENQVCWAAAEVERLGGFKHPKPGKELIGAIQHFLTVAASGQFSPDFIKTALLGRSIRALSVIDLQDFAIQTIINLSYSLSAPFSLLFLLFEPILIAQTQTSHRVIYEKASKSAPFIAFTGVEITQEKGKLFGYLTPFGDSQEKNAKNAQFCPNFDVQLNSTEPSKQIAIAKQILSNLAFFFDATAGGRSHWYCLNLLLSSLASKNEELSLFALQKLPEALPLLAGPGWMVEEAQALGMKLGAQIGEMKQRMAQAFSEPKKEAARPEIDHKNPITGALTPFLTKLLNTSASGKQMASILGGLGGFVPYFSDDQIGRILLPAVNSSLESVERHSAAVGAFADFALLVHGRCSGKTLSVLFAPRLLKMAYSEQLESGDKTRVLEVLEVLIQVILAERRGQGQKVEVKSQYGIQQEDTYGYQVEGQYAEQGAYTEQEGQGGYPTDSNW